MDLRLFVWCVNLFIAGCIFYMIKHWVNKKREEKRQKAYIKFMKEHNVIMEGP